MEGMGRLAAFPRVFQHSAEVCGIERGNLKRDNAIWTARPHATPVSLPLSSAWFAPDCAGYGSFVRLLTLK